MRSAEAHEGIRALIRRARTQHSKKIAQMPPLSSNNRAYVPQRYGCLAPAGSDKVLYLSTGGIASCVGMAIWFKSGHRQWGFLAHLDEDSLGSLGGELLMLKDHISRITGSPMIEAKVILVGNVGGADLMEQARQFIPAIIQWTPCLDH